MKELRQLLARYDLLSDKEIKAVDDNIGYINIGLKQNPDLLEYDYFLTINISIDASKILLEYYKIKYGCNFNIEVSFYSSRERYGITFKKIEV